MNDPKPAQRTTPQERMGRRLVEMRRQAGYDSTENLAKVDGDDFVYRNHVNAAIDQLRLALRTTDTGERIRLLTGALTDTGNAIGQLAQFDSDGRPRPPRK